MQYRNAGSSKTTNTTVQTMDGTVPAGTPQALFNSLRYDPTGDPEMQWDFATTAGKKLEVRLYFADPCACTNDPGERVFDVAIDGTTVLDNFDVAAATGSNRGTMKKFEITTDGNLDIDFLHGAIQNPLVNGIEILQQNTAPPVSGTNGIVSRVVRRREHRRRPGDPDQPGHHHLDQRPGCVLGRRDAVLRDEREPLPPDLQRHVVRAGQPGRPVPQPELGHRADRQSGTTTYAGVTSNFYAEINSVTGMFYSGGRLFYTLSGQNGLFWRWFTPDSGVVGADKFTVTGATGFSTAGAIFVSGNEPVRHQPDHRHAVPAGLDGHRTQRHRHRGERAGAGRGRLAGRSHLRRPVTTPAVT